MYSFKAIYKQCQEIHGNFERKFTVVNSLLRLLPLDHSDPFMREMQAVPELIRAQEATEVSCEEIFGDARLHLKEIRLNIPHIFVFPNPIFVGRNRGGILADKILEGIITDLVPNVIHFRICWRRRGN